MHYRHHRHHHRHHHYHKDIPIKHRLHAVGLKQEQRRITVLDLKRKPYLKR